MSEEKEGAGIMVFRESAKEAGAQARAKERRCSEALEKMKDKGSEYARGIAALAALHARAAIIYENME